jgi:HEAT repeat protein
MSDPIEIPFDDVIAALLDEAALLQPRYLYRLSDLEADEATKFIDVWPNLSLRRRQALMEDLVELGLADDLLSYESIGRHTVNDDDPLVRTLAVRLLWEFDSDDLRLIFLSLLENDPAADVRAAAASGLGQFVYFGELEELSEDHLLDLEEHLLQAINRDDAPVVRRKALESLGFSSRPEVPGLIERAYRSEDKDWLVSALLAMGRSMDSRWEEAILSELKSKTPAIRAEAARAAGELEIAASTASLIDLTEDSEDIVRSAAIWSLSQIGGEQARQTLENLYRETDEEEDVDFLEIALDNLAFTEGMEPFSLIDLDEDKTEQELYDMLLAEEGYWDYEGDNGNDLDSTDEDEDLLDFDEFTAEDEDSQDWANSY